MLCSLFIFHHFFPGIKKNSLKNSEKFLHINFSFGNDLRLKLIEKFENKLQKYSSLFYHFC